jgi:hypothetical protein
MSTPTDPFDPLLVVAKVLHDPRFGLLFGVTVTSDLNDAVKGLSAEREELFRHRKQADNNVEPTPKPARGSQIP